MHPTILDTHTGECVTLSNWEASVFWWTEGNGSCDCNRAIAMGHENPDSNKGEVEACLGCARYIAIDVHGDLEGIRKDDVLQMMNEGYPQELISQHVG